MIEMDSPHSLRALRMVNTKVFGPLDDDFRAELTMFSGEWSLGVFLKSMTTFVLSNFRDRLFTLHQFISSFISYLYADSLLQSHHCTVVSSAKFMLEFAVPCYRFMSKRWCLKCFCH